MLGVISRSIYAFSSLELFLLKVLREDNTNLLKKSASPRSPT